MPKMILYMARDVAIRFDPTSLGGKWAMLSINDQGTFMPKFEHPFEEVFIAHFADTDDPGAANAPHPALAEDIQDALARWVAMDYNIAVHCFMGVSRSAAIALHVEQYSEGARMRKYSHANPLVLQLLREAEAAQGDEVFTAKRTQYIGYAYPYDIGKRKRPCWDCGGLGCANCEDGYVQSKIFY